MVFSSLIFLFCFLPLVLAGYVLQPRLLRNTYLLLASLIFYSWGEGIYVLLMLGSIAVNYFFGLRIYRTEDKRVKRFFLVTGVVLNLSPLVFFKYSEFLVANFNGLLVYLHCPFFLPVPELHLPLGISFFTFQSLSYLVDTWRGTTEPQRNPINLGLYIALFPQLIAGPIVRYHDLARQLLERKVDLAGFACGVERFIIGLGKKVLLANNLAILADTTFAIAPDGLTTAAVWCGATAYALQIYYDFSGYSDMAIGLGQMFGFTFLENFNYPYISKSIQDFWRRWHISLSNWFRDYLYIPLGGNRKGSTRTMVNLLIVFLLCGFWHGASWTFIVWGLFHGFFLAIERTRFGDWLKRIPVLAQHGYALLVVLVGWIFFRAETLDEAVDYIKILFGGGHAKTMPYEVLLKLDALTLTVLALGLVGMTPFWKKLLQCGVVKWSSWTRYKITALETGRICYLTAILLLSLSSLATGVYNPFIYFRF